MGKSYRFISSDASQKKIVCAFTVSNDSLKVYDMSNSARNKLQRGIASVKRMRSYPAVLIGRLGVSVEFQGKGLHLGNQLMDFIKLWFLHPNNKTGCRFIVVDAYNTPKTIAYYQCNGFSFLYQNEDDEKRMFKISLESSLKTRLMIYDLMNLVKLLGTQN